MDHWPKTIGKIPCDENGEKWQVYPGKPSKTCPFYPGKPSQKCPSYPRGQTKQKLAILPAWANQEKLSILPKWVNTAKNVHFAREHLYTAQN